MGYDRISTSLDTIIPANRSADTAVDAAFPLFTALSLQAGTLEIVIAVVLAIPFLVILGVVVWQYVNWRDDFFVITTQRVVHIERAWPFSTQYEETRWIISKIFTKPNPVGQLICSIMGI